MNKYSYRVDQNEGVVPEPMGKPIVHAEDPVTSRSVFELRVQHVLARDTQGAARRGFRANICAGGVPNTESDRIYFGEDGVAYGMAVANGLQLIDEKIRQLSGTAVAVT